MNSILDLVKIEEGIYKLIFEVKTEKINKLSSFILQIFSDTLNELAGNSDIKVLLFESGEKDIFIAGADINEINNIKSGAEGAKMAMLGQSIINKFATLPFPTIAVINGVCLGGGLELALACTYRITTDNPKVKIGLVEVSLGIIPGFGGTQRLPRLIGLQKALPLILGAKTLDGKKAFRQKIVDAFYPQELIDQKALLFAKEILNKDGVKKIQKHRKLKGLINLILEKTWIGRSLVYKLAKQNILKQTKGKYPAPLIALKTIRETFTKSLSQGLIIEAKNCGSLLGTEIPQNLIGLYFINEEIKHDTQVNSEIKAKPIKTAAVLGAGVMGGGIVWLLSYKNIPTRLKDISWEAITRGYELITKIYDQLLKIKRLTNREVNINFHKITATNNYSGFGKQDLIIEAIVEEINLKKQVLTELENQTRPDTIIASNTSALSITEIASVLKNPERFIGMHFFNPVNRMPLIEVIPGEKTSQETIATIVDLAKKLEKIPIVVKNCPGFLVNRILLPYMNEALFLAEEGVNFEFIDKVLVDFGMPMGPFTLADEVGIDICYKVANILREGYGKRMEPSGLISTIYNEHLLGKKVNKGFYLYSKRKKIVNLEVQKLIKSHSKAPNTINKMDILNRCIYVMINESTLCLEEKIIEKPTYLDMALIMGIGFPPFRGGLFKYADKIGIINIVKVLQHYQNTIGIRFKPSKLLISMAESNQKFY